MTTCERLFSVLFFTSDGLALQRQVWAFLLSRFNIVFQRANLFGSLFSATKYCIFLGKTLGPGEFWEGGGLIEGSWGKSVGGLAWEDQTGVGRAGPSWSPR